MRLFLCALTCVALVACDSSSGSKSSPVTPTTPIPVTVAPGANTATPSGDNAIGTSSPEDSAANGAVIDPLASELKFGLTTTRVDLLKRLGDDLSIKAKDFQTTANTLAESTLAYCEAPSAESLANAQNAWRSTMDAWQYFEVFQIGPVAENAKVLKFNIYAWPDPANYCRVDEEALKASKTASYKLPPNYNRKGLQAIEYLLFDSSLGSRCAAGSATVNEWSALPTETKVATRCAYLKALTNEVAAQGATLQSKWGVPGANYLTQILADNDKVNQTIQTLYEAAFYVDLEIKNQKLAGPAGIDTRYCNKVPEACPENAEFVYSNHSRQAVNVNIAAFVDMLFGSAKSGRAGGLSALVRAEGNGAANAVVDRTEAIAATLAAQTAEDPESTLDQLIAKFAKENCDLSSASWICQTRNGIRQIFTDLKGEYAAILKVKAPSAAAGDND